MNITKEELEALFKGALTIAAAAIGVTFIGMLTLVAITGLILSGTALLASLAIRLSGQ